ncbi:MAG: hypothetical protein ACP5PS_00985 [Bacteroidales bacterium]
MDGFGFTLTEGSAEVISSLSSATQSTLLNELFSTNGIGISVLRISIGASDMSSSSYSYQEMVTYNGTTAPVGGFIRLKGATNGKYVTSNDGSSAMVCDRNSASSWETFEVVDAGGGLIALRGSNGKYVSGTSPCIAMLHPSELQRNLHGYRLLQVRYSSNAVQTITLYVPKMAPRR